ncbi:hypothetical protein BGX21_006026 [Mortierella sp. AD011]|nr:hypothetical protein BGX20_008768 [Mortierella sp. AD010]KAF9403955.1 hypothetical protein BGX21_006026 [Mortierella sp. AD011]
MGLDTRGNWAEQFKSEVQHYTIYIHVVILMFIYQLAITTALQEQRGGQNIVFLFYALVTDVIVYGIGLASLELALIFTNLTACGFSREAIMVSISTFQLKYMFTIAEPEKP